MSVQQLQLIPVPWECQGDQEQLWESRAGGEGSWISLVGITSRCSWGAGAPLPSHHIFFFFFFPEVFLWLLIDNQEFLSTQFRPHCGRIPWVVSAPNCSSGLPSSCCVLWQREPPGFPLLELLSSRCTPTTALPHSCLGSVRPPRCVRAGFPPYSIDIPRDSPLFFSCLCS